MISSCAAYSSGRFVIGVPVSSRMLPLSGMLLLMFFAALVLCAVLFLQ